MTKAEQRVLQRFVALEMGKDSVTWKAARKWFKRHGKAIDPKATR